MLRRRTCSVDLLPDDGSRSRSRYRDMLRDCD